MGIVGTATSVFFACLSGRLLLNLFPFPLSKTKSMGEFCFNKQSAGSNWVQLLLCPLQAQAQCNSGNALARKIRQILFTFITL